MDHRLVAWGRAVKGRGKRALPPLWLFSDAARLPDVVAAAGRLPRGLCGVVLRHDGTAGRAALARALARVCRGRRLMLSVAGDWRLAAAVRVGVHLRGGVRPAGMPRGLPALTASAHGAAELRRACRAGARLAFLSPAFPTASHPGAPALGPARWGRLAQRTGVAVAALGGIDGRTVRRLPRRCRHAGAIGALGG
jgi:thiamine-phosphate pyrophosphorylase